MGILIKRECYKLFEEFLKAERIPYVYRRTDTQNIIQIDANIKEVPSFEVRFYFGKTGDMLSVFAGEIFKAGEGKTGAALRIINEFNDEDAVFATLSMDKEGSVMASYSTVVLSENCIAVCKSIINDVLELITKAYPKLCEI